MKKLLVLLMVPIMALAFMGYVWAGVPNPAAVYCGLMGGDSAVVTEADGAQHSTCVFPDVTCDAWDFFEGQCGVDHSYCAQHGYGLAVMNDGKDPFSNPYAACFDKTTQKIICPPPDPNNPDIPPVCSVAGLLNLPDLLNQGLCPGCGPIIAAVPSGPTTPAALPLILPTSFDWRDNNGNWMTSVKDQSQCGSCWFFSAVGTVEAAYNIAYNNPGLGLNLAEEYGTANCNANGDGGCCGGFNDHALASIRDNGVPDETCMPYNVAKYNTSTCSCYPSPPCNNGPTPPACPNGGGTNSCSYSPCGAACGDVTKRLIKIKDYHSAGSDTATMKQNLIDHGPLSVCLNFKGTFDTSVNAPYGVYKCTSSATDHCVVIVGYNDSISAWTIKNSWGSTDGPHGNGYREVGYDQCGINSQAYWAETAALVFPVAKCKDVTVVADSTCHATASIDNGSFDPNGASVTLSQVPPPPPFTLGTTPATLTVKDPAGLTATCTGNVTVVDKTPPSITCPAAMTLECTSPAGATGTFTVAATDNCGIKNTTCTPPSNSTFPIGTTPVSCKATDTSNNSSAPCATSVKVVDTTPPTIASVTASPNTLWPANHKMVPATIGVSVTDTCDPTPSCHITSVSSNEPENGLGDGDTAPDWQITGALTVNLRAERSGTGSGRLYTVGVTCTDHSGNTSKGSVGVTVPHSQGK